MRIIIGAVAAMLAATPGLALGQTNEPAQVVTQAAIGAPVEAPVVAPVEAPTTITIPAGTTIVVEFSETLSSRTSSTGQLVGLRLRDPLVVDGRTIAEAGAIGGGEVIDASRSGMGGRSGKLIVSGRFMEIAGQRARIRGLQVVIAGEDNSREAVNTMMLVPYVGWMGGFIQGGEIEIPAGTRAEARLTTNLVVPLSALSAPTAETQSDNAAPLTAPTETTAVVEDTQ
ncbi:MAG: hypothetical protein NT015_13360 [Alphaproteobacteria bacterium]|nr:hypothetical protein [Alphaproteobacteria bacterium]